MRLSSCWPAGSLPLDTTGRIKRAVGASGFSASLFCTELAFVSDQLSSMKAASGTVGLSSMSEGVVQGDTELAVFAHHDTTAWDIIVSQWKEIWPRVPFTQEKRFTGKYGSMSGKHQDGMSPGAPPRPEVVKLSRRSTRPGTALSRPGLC